jgi:hypothetical protein
MHLTEPLAMPSGDAEMKPGIYMMGQVAKKFILRPDIQQLLSELEQKRVDDLEKAALGKVKKEEDVDGLAGTKTVADLVAPASPSKAAKAKPKRKAAA